MELKLKVRFSTVNEPWLCFRHAIKAALTGQEVRIDVDDFGSEHYLGTTVCRECEEEARGIGEI